MLQNAYLDAKFRFYTAENESIEKSVVSWPSADRTELEAVQGTDDTCTVNTAGFPRARNEQQVSNPISKRSLRH